MATGSNSAQDTADVTGSARDGEKRIPVLVRLTEGAHRDMRRAMAEAGVRTNQEFAVAAIAEKVARVANRRGDEDRRKNDRRAA
jgi:hypothetical protein